MIKARMLPSLSIKSLQQKGSTALIPSRRAVVGSKKTDHCLPQIWKQIHLQVGWSPCGKRSLHKWSLQDSRRTRGSGRTHKWKVLEALLPLIYDITKLLSKSLNCSFFQVKFLCNTPGPQESKLQMTKQNK